MREKINKVIFYLKDFFYYEPKHFLGKIEKIIDWIPILWKTYDFDCSSIFWILRKKLIRMEKAIRQGHASNAKQTADEIKIAIILLDRICERDYNENALKEVNQKYGEMYMDMEDDHIKFCWPHAYTNHQKDQAQFMQTLAYKHAEKVKQNDKQYLFSFIVKKHRRWWD